MLSRDITTVPSSSLHLLFNPAAGSGHARERVERAYAALRTVGPVTLMESLAPRDEIRLASEAARAGARALVVLGGDGSVSNAARGLLAVGGDTPLAVLAAGTGNDTVKSLGWPAHDYLAMSRRIADGAVRAIDVGEFDGNPFINSAGVGFDVDVLQQMSAPQRLPLRGTARYVSVALRRLFAYRGLAAQLRWDDDSSALLETQPWMTVVFANGQWFGGAFRIAPAANMNNGSLDLVAIRDISPIERAKLFALALRGRHIPHPSVITTRQSEFTLEFPERVYYQADGELYRTTGRVVTVRTRAGALRVIV